MPLTLQAFNFSIICDENELELYDVKQEGPDSESTTAFVASEAGKVSASVPKIPFVTLERLTVEISNSESWLLTTSWTSIIWLWLTCISMGSGFPDIFYEVETGSWLSFEASVTPLPRIVLSSFRSSNLSVCFMNILWTSCLILILLFATEDPDLEHAPIGAEMGVIEVRAFRCRYLGCRPLKSGWKAKLHQGRVSERSKKAGWHHVRYYTSQAIRRILIHM